MYNSESAIRMAIEHVAFKAFPHAKPLLSLAASALELIHPPHQRFSNDIPNTPLQPSRPRTYTLRDRVTRLLTQTLVKWPTLWPISEMARSKHSHS